MKLKHYNVSKTPYSSELCVWIIKTVVWREETFTDNVKQQRLDVHIQISKNELRNKRYSLDSHCFACTLGIVIYIADISVHQQNNLFADSYKQELKHVLVGFFGPVKQSWLRRHIKEVETQQYLLTPMNCLCYKCISSKRKSSSLEA